MKRLTPSNYQADTLYPRVARAMADLVREGKPASLPAVFLKMGVLSEANLQAWRCRKVPYLERVVLGSLGKTSRVVRIFSLCAHDMKLLPAPHHAAGNIQYKGVPLRFSKTGERGVEEAYKRVFVARPPKGPPEEPSAAEQV